MWISRKVAAPSPRSEQLEYSFQRRHRVVVVVELVHSTAAPRGGTAPPSRQVPKLACAWRVKIVARSPQRPWAW